MITLFGLFSCARVLCRDVHRPKIFGPARPTISRPFYHLSVSHGAVLQTTVAYVVNFVKLFAYCCENFQKCGPEDDGPACSKPRPGPRAMSGQAWRPVLISCIVTLLSLFHTV